MIQAASLTLLGIVLLMAAWIMYTISRDPKGPKRTAAEIRGVPDEKLKFLPSANLCTIAIAMMLESQGVDDEPLIRELYRRGRNGTPK